MATRLELINAALARLGEQELEFESAAAKAAFGDAGVVDPEDDLQRIAGAIYPQVRASLLNAHPWSWLTQRTRLVLRPAVEGEDAGAWPYANRYRLPNPSVNSVRAVFTQASSDTPTTTGWKVEGGWLYTNVEIAFIEDQRQVDETVFPQLFQNALTLKLAAEMSLPIKEDLETMRYYERLAENALNDAMRVDAQSQPVKVIPRFDWEEARLAETYSFRRHAVT